MTLNAYTNRQASKEETRQLLKKYDLSKLDTFEKNIKSSIEKLLENDTPQNE